MKELISQATSPAFGLAGDLRVSHLKNFVGMGDEAQKGMLSVIEERLNSPYPVNLQALHLLDKVFPESVLLGLVDKLTALSNYPQTLHGSVEVRAAATPLLKKAKAAKDKKDADSQKSREATILGMWGGLTNPAHAQTHFPPHYNLMFNGGGMNYYPNYLRPPGAPPAWPHSAPTGWQSYVYWGWCRYT